MALYVGIGHGMEPNGVFDPGAVGADGTREHDLNAQVVGAVDVALNRCNVVHHVETDSGASHDPDFQGSIAAVNAGKFTAAIEVHFDEGIAPRGGFGIYFDDQSPAKRLADAIRDQWGARGLPQRQNKADDRGLGFLKHTNCPAVIWECDPTTAHSPAETTQMGEAIAAGICAYLGVPFALVVDQQPPQVTPMFPTPFQIKDVVAHCPCPAGGAWVLTIDGAVFAVGGAPLHGAPITDVNAHWPDGGRRGAQIEPSAGGYVVTDTAGERYAYGLG